MVVFDHAPVTQGIVSVLTIFSILPIFFPSIARLLTFPNLSTVVVGLQFWRPLTNSLFFLSFTEFTLSMILLFYIRILERSFGSNKFGALVFISFFFSIIVQIVSATLLLKVPSGLHVVIFTLATLYAIKVPSQQNPGFSLPAAGISIFGKKVFFMFVLSFAIAGGFTTSIPSLIGGIILGTCYNLNLFHIKSFKLPKAVHSISVNYIGPAVGVHPRAPHARVNLAQPNMFPPRNNVQFPNQAYDPPHQFVQLAEEHISTLCELGFTREEAVAALLQTRNNLELASNILIGGQYN